jgi:ribose transport system ATP-binding protein
LTASTLHVRNSRSGVSSSISAPALEACALSKTFGLTLALRNCNLAIGQGEVHALVGENGSGKSTLIKILSGYHMPDPGGMVRINAGTLEFGSSASALTLGCRVVHQDLGLIETLPIIDNLSLSSGFPSRLGTIRSKVAYRRAAEDMERVGVTIDPRTPVGELSMSAKAGVAFARALRGNLKLLVLDEPTATLSDREVRTLLDIVRTVATQGVGVLYVTHRIDEIFEIAQRVTVLRDGAIVAEESVDALDHRELVNLLVGTEFDEVGAAAAAIPHGSVGAVLSARNIVAPPLDNISLQVRPGEVLGIAGVTGSGRESLLGALFGAVPRYGGIVEVDGQRVPGERPDLAKAARVAYLPADRKLNSAFHELSAIDNLTIADLRPFWKRLHLRRSLEARETSAWFDRLSIRPSHAIAQKLSLFSGGNQQKIVFARWSRLEPKVFLLDEPTQGVDVGAKRELHMHILKAAALGTAVVVNSSDTDELIALCSRVLVLRDGRVVADLEGLDLTLQSVLRLSLTGDGAAHQ